MRMRAGVEIGWMVTLLFVVLMTIWISFIFVALLVSIIFISVRECGVVIPCWPISPFPLVVILVVIPKGPAVVSIFPPLPASASPISSRVVSIACLTITAFTPTSREVPRLAWLDDRQGFFGGPSILSLRRLLVGTSIERSLFEEGGVAGLAEVDDGVVSVDLTEGRLKRLQGWKLKRNRWLGGLRIGQLELGTLVGILRENMRDPQLIIFAQRVYLQGLGTGLFDSTHLNPCCEGTGRGYQLV